MGLYLDNYSEFKASKGLNVTEYDVKNPCHAFPQGFLWKMTNSEDVLNVFEAPNPRERRNLEVRLTDVKGSKVGRIRRCLVAILLGCSAVALENMGLKGLGRFLFADE